VIGWLRVKHALQISQVVYLAVSSDAASELGNRGMCFWSSGFWHANCKNCHLLLHLWSYLTLFPDNMPFQAFAIRIDPDQAYTSDSCIWRQVCVNSSKSIFTKWLFQQWLFNLFGVHCNAIYCAFQKPMQTNFLAIFFLLLAGSNSNSPRSFQRFRQTLRPNFIWIQQVMIFPIDPIL